MQGESRSVQTLVAFAIAGMVVSVAARPVGASSKSAELTYERSPEASACPDERALRDGIAARLGYDPFREGSDRRVRVRVRPDDEASGYTARIKIRTPDRSSPGVRNLSSSDPNCEKLTRALIFTVSVAIDPGSVTGGPPRGQRPDAARRALMAAVLRLHDAHAAADRAQSEIDRERPASPQPTAPETSGSPESEAAPITFRASLGGGVTVGTAPRPTALLRLGGEFGRHRWSVRLDGRAELPSRRSIEGGNLETSLALAEIAGCGRIDFAFGCAVAGVGRLRLTGVDLADSRSGTQLYLASGPRIGGDLRLSKTFTLRLQGQLLATLVRTRAVVDSRPVWATPDLSGSLSTLLVVDF